MKITDLAQTVIFICCLIIIPVLGFAYLLYSQASLKEFEILDKSFSATIGIFSGSATLAAAYIASRLFNDWRSVQSGVNKSEHAKLTLLSLSQIQVTLDYYLSQVEIYASNYKKDDLEICQNLRIEITEKYTKFMTEFQLNLNYYEAVYGEELSNHNEYTINEFNSYFFTINGTLTRIIKDDTLSRDASIQYYLRQAKSRKLAFKENTVKNISKKLAPFIILK